MDGGEIYKFTSTELNEIQSYLVILQNEITTSELSGSHKAKLTEKLKEFKSGLNIPERNPDIFWAFICYGDIAFRTYENDHIPESLKAIAKIVWNVQCRTEKRDPNEEPPIKLI
jgi:hypothetical protein